MSFMDTITGIMDVKLLGIPVIFIIGALFFVIWFVWNYKPKTGRKRLNLSKQVRSDFDMMYKTFGEPVGKKLNAGFIRVGYAIGQFPIYWDKYSSVRNNLKANKQLKSVVAKDTKEGKHIDEMTCFKICKNNVFSRGLALLGFKTNYMIIPTKYLDIGTKDISFPASLQVQEFLGILFSTKTSRDYVENIAFKLNRQEELTEIADFIPKQNYLEVSTATSVAKARERAKIESDKYKGQIEGAEDS